jgi:hypothetical protein
MRNKLTSHNPKLPEHNEGSSNTSRGHLGRVNGYRRVLCPDANTHDKSSRKEFLPCPRKTGSNRGGGETASSEENLASSTQVVIERIDDESTTVCFGQSSM